MFSCYLSATNQPMANPMRPRTRRILLVAVTAGGITAAITLTLARSENAPSGSELGRTPTSATTLRGETIPSPRLRSSARVDNPPVLDTDESSVENEGQDDEKRWDSMSDTDRIAHLKSTLSAAFDAMDAGDVSQSTMASAEGALTVSGVRTAGPLGTGMPAARWPG